MDLDKQEMIICILSVSAALEQLLSSRRPSGMAEFKVQRGGEAWGPFRGVHEAKTIFITILRHFLPFSLGWHFHQ